MLSVIHECWVPGGRICHVPRWLLVVQFSQILHLIKALGIKVVPSLQLRFEDFYVSSSPSLSYIPLKLTLAVSHILIYNVLLFLQYRFAFRQPQEFLLINKQLSNFLNFPFLFAFSPFIQVFFDYTLVLPKRNRVLVQLLLALVLGQSVPVIKVLLIVVGAGYLVLFF